MAKVSRATNRGVSPETASIIIEAASQAVRWRKLRPMTIAVLDAGGNLIAFKRADDKGIRRSDAVIEAIRAADFAPKPAEPSDGA